jgi:crossover junction endodeoxyribonuclease RuvC
MRNTSATPVRILGLDPGLRRTGWGIIESEGARLRWIAHGVIAPADTGDFAVRLLALFEGIEAVIAAHSPDEAAVEETFVNVNPSSTLKLGQARAAAMIAPARAGLPVAEYSAKSIKKSVVGTGNADKAQIAFMIARLLPASQGVKADAADALACAIAHAHHRTLSPRTLAVAGHKLDVSAPGPKGRGGRRLTAKGQAA